MQSERMSSAHQTKQTKQPTTQKKDTSKLFNADHLIHTHTRAAAAADIGHI